MGLKICVSFFLPGCRLHPYNMPSGPALYTDNQWEPVVWNKTGPKGKDAKSSTEVNAAHRSGQEIDTSKKLAGGTNKAAHSVCSNAKKLDENSATFRHETVSHSFKLALQQARVAKNLTQAQLASQINEKSTVINEYESGKAIPKGEIINKLNRALGVRLPKAKI